jgi:hypothetical protein
MVRLADHRVVVVDALVRARISARDKNARAVAIPPWQFIKAPAKTGLDVFRATEARLDASEWRV